MANHTYDAAAEMIESHEGFQGGLAEASCAAFHITLDPESPDADAQADEVRDFIANKALPHMDHEEAVIYPHALANGVPQACIDALLDEHASLRQIAELVQTDAVVDNDRALLMLQFIQAFDRHATREEAVLSLFRDKGSS